MDITFLVLAVCATFVVGGVQGYHECLIRIFDYPIPEENFICEPLRTYEFLVFRFKLKRALLESSPAMAYAASTPDPFEIPETPGRCLCPGERKQILGFWARRDRLCWLVPFEHYSFMKCDRKEGCSSEKSRCEPSGHTRRRVLVFCEQYFHKGGGGRREPDGFNPEETEVTRQEMREMIESDISDETPAGDSPDSRKKRGTKKGRNNGFFWVFFELPQSCCCKLCDCFNRIN